MEGINSRPSVIGRRPTYLTSHSEGYGCLRERGFGSKNWKKERDLEERLFCNEVDLLLGVLDDENKRRRCLRFHNSPVITGGRLSNVQHLDQARVTPEGGVRARVKGKGEDAIWSPKACLSKRDNISNPTLVDCLL